MTLGEFLVELRNTQGIWELREGKIRTGKDNHCPQTYLYRSNQYIRYDIREVWKAADNDSEHNPELRAKLLEACGLSEIAESK